MIASPPKGKAGWAPRFRRGAQPVTPIVGAIFVVFIGSLVWIYGGNHGGDQVEPPVNAENNRQTMCDIYPTREPCRDIEVAGVMWRYAYLPAQRQTTDTVIVDFGGPGLSVLSGTANLGAFQQQFTALSEGFNLLMLEEPWVTQEIKPACDSSMTEFYRALRSGKHNLDVARDSVRGNCELGVEKREWGFSAALYPQVVDSVVRRHGLTLKGFVGHSWGSVRLAYLDGERFDWAILIRPFPIGVDVQVLATERAKVILGMPYSISPVKSTEVQSRSIPVTYFDQLSAIVELAYVDDPFFRDHAAAIFSGADKVRIGELSDALWGRYGRESVSPARLAQWQEVCSSVDLGSDSNRRGTEVENIVATMFSFCASGKSGKPSRSTARNTCIVTAPLDGVTPGKLVEEAFQGAGGNITWAESNVRSHTSFDGLDNCLQVVL